MWQLISCDIWRDGGSYSAVLANGSSNIALWLQVSPWDRLEARSYAGLFLSQGSDPTLKSNRLGPDEELEWCRALRQVLDAKPGVAADQELLRELVELLEARAAPS
ncbi:MAG TPA: hypothetical protein VI197_11890 [Polyangiaceae bacterium]